MAHPTLLLSPEGSRDRQGPVTPTLLGAVRTRYGRYGQVWLLEEATTNLITNPACIAGGGIAAPLNGATSEFVTDVPDLHPTAAKVTTYANQPNSQGFRFQSATLGTVTARTFTASVSVKGDGQLAVRMLAFYTDGSFDETRVEFVATATPQRIVSPPVTVVTTKTLNYVQMRVALWGAARDTTFWVSRAQIEEKDYATSYTDGSLGAGYTWAGSANASTSTRAHGYVTAPAQAINPHKGTILLRAKRDYSSAGSRYLFSIGTLGQATSDWMGAAWHPTTQANQHTWSSTSPSQTIGVIGAPVVPVGQDLVYAYRWNGTTVTLTQRDGSTLTGTRNPVTGVINGSVFLGRYSGFGLGGHIESFVAYNTDLSDAEVNYLMNMDRPWSWERMTPRIGGVIRTFKGDLTIPKG